MPKGTRGGKRTGSIASIKDRSEFVWELAQKGITYAKKDSTINQFRTNNPMTAGSYDDLLADVDAAATEIAIAKRRFPDVPLYINKPVPAGYTRIAGATTAPNGFAWYSNNQSRFSGNRKTILVAISDYYDGLYLPF